MRRIRQVLFLGLAAAVLLVGCAGSQRDAASASATVRSNGEVILYCSLPEKQLRRLKAGFEEQYPNIALRYHYASTGKILNRLAAQQQTAHIEADLVWVDAPASYIGLKKEGLLTPYLSPKAADLDAAFLEAEHYYTGARISSFVIAYNTRIISPEQAPKSWQELLEPQWNGQVVMADPADAGSTSHLVAALMLREGYGQDYFLKLRDNACMLESSTDAVHARVARGDYPIGICLDYAVATLAEGGEPIAGVYPEQDMISIFSPLGLVADGPNPDNARLLYDYILSLAGQESLVTSYLHSVRSDVAQPALDLQSLMGAGGSVQAALIYQYRAEVRAAFDGIFFRGRTLLAKRRGRAREDSATPL